MIIGKIREKSTLLLIMIGGAMLAFILGDALKSGSFLINGSPTEIANIDGQSIQGRDFEDRVQQTIDNYKTKSGQSTVDAATTDQLREQTWNQLVHEIVFGNELDAAGVSVSSDELYDMVQGSHPHPQVVQAFTDPQTGKFDQARVIGFLKKMETDEEMKARWVTFENNIKELRRAEKYNTLIKKGLYVTDAQSESDFLAKNQPVNVQYVLKRYNSVPDSTIEVTEAEVKDYYTDHKFKYEQEASRDINYVVFNVEPSKEDREKVAHWAETLKPDFESTDNDTLLVNRESDVRFNAQWLAEGIIPGAIDSIMFAAEKGFVYGPYVDGETFHLAKLIGIKTAPDSVKARHILITPKKLGSDEKAKALADSLKNAISHGSDFASLAQRFSEDPGSAAKGGELGWFQEGQMVPSFNSVCFDGHSGDLRIAKSRFGYHIIEVLSQKGKTEKRAVAFIDRKVEPSTKTFQQMYGKADEFARSVTSVASFDQEAASRGLNKRIASNLKESDRTIAGLENPRQLIRWAFKADKEDLSEVLELGDAFVVGILTAIREDGYADMEEIHDELEAGAKQDKKAAMFISEFGSARAGDIQTIADNMNLPVEEKDGILFSEPAIQGLGRELALMGTIAGLQAGDISRPLKGEQGVYVVYIDNRAEVPLPENLRANAEAINSSLSSRVDYEVYEALKEKAEIVDHRSRFF